MTQTLSPAFYNVPPGMIATVVTHLEMRSQPDTQQRPPPKGITLSGPETLTPATYRTVYRAVGAPWLWFSRLSLSDIALTAIIHHRDVEVFRVMAEDRPVGLLELDFRNASECELAFFGLTPAMTGQGIGRWLMSEAITRAWARPISRLHVHTCTLDSPHALGFYQSQGFICVRQQVEIAQDPRLDGRLPLSSAPQIPIIESETHLTQRP